MIIGSRALGYWLGEDFGGDTDIITDDNVRGHRVESQGLAQLNNADALRYATGHTINVDGQDWAVCSMLGLALIKRSHLHRIRKWERHMFMFRKMGWGSIRDSLSPADREFLQTRKKLTKQEYNSPSLNKPNAEFFDDYVEKHFDHDSIHEYVAYGDRPVYERLKRDMAMAMCERDLWEELPHEDKIRCVLEECYVIGLERWMVPACLSKSKVMPARMAAMKGLQKVCTTLCSGWFRDFAIDYYEDIAANVDGKKMEEFIEEMCYAR